jgi:hypothetical protein
MAVCLHIDEHRIVGMCDDVIQVCFHVHALADLWLIDLAFLPAGVLHHSHLWLHRLCLLWAHAHLQQLDGHGAR